jgi:hypothetical protein
VTSKIEKDIPIFKKGDSKNINNCRPETIVLIIENVFQLLLKQANGRLFSSLFSPCQYGFRNNLPTKERQKHVTSSGLVLAFVPVNVCRSFISCQIIDVKHHLLSLGMNYLFCKKQFFRELTDEIFSQLF